MTIALHSRLALPALLIAASSALAQVDGPAPRLSVDTRTMGASGSATTRQEVRRQALEELRRHHDMVVTVGETVGAPLAEVYPGLYSGMTSGRSRAEVSAELREAQRSGVIQPRIYWGNVN
ncbi:MAG: hypothetical protein V4609_07715 [Pseudomonadota bacterium]